MEFKKNKIYKVEDTNIIMGLFMDYTVRMFFTNRKTIAKDVHKIRLVGEMIDPYYEPTGEAEDDFYTKLPEKLKKMLPTTKGWNVNTGDLKKIKIHESIKDKKLYKKTIIGNVI